MEHFSGTNSYRTSEFGNPAYRLADLDANAYQSSPDQRGKFVVTVKKCSKTTGSGDTAVVTQGTCLYSNTKDVSFLDYKGRDILNKVNVKDF